MTIKIWIDSWGRFMDGPANDIRSKQIYWKGYGSVRSLNESNIKFKMYEDELGCSWIEIEE